MIEYFVAAFFAAQATQVAQAGTPAPTGPGGSSTAKGGKPDAGTGKVSASSMKQKVDISADKLLISNVKNQVIWTGRVKAIRKDTIIRCDTLVADYTEQQEVRKIDCTGGVDVVDGRRRAKGERATFDNNTGILVVTGSPEAWDGGNHLIGTKVTFNVTKDTIEVENAKAIMDLQPKDKDKKGKGKKGKSTP